MNKDLTNPKIEILPEHIIDQIKAGEVLERPASLVKELIENSLDADASEINIHLIENGLDLLSIEDNGHGMSFTNLPYAFLRHATSKLKNFDDLYRLQSFGFRGEALASVAASARLTCITQPTDLTVPGGKMIINGGAEELLIEYLSSTHGTSLYIKDLFYNTPARLKFIKSKVSERSALKKMLYAFVLSNPKTMFSIKWDEKEREVFKAVTSNEDVTKRVEQVFFTKISKYQDTNIWHSFEEYEDYKVEVYFSPTTCTTPQYRHHYLFANNRFFQDKSLHQSVLRTLEPLWRFGESGHYMVKITVPPADLDVNVHPNKTQIKFLKSDVIYSLLVTSLREAMKLFGVSSNRETTSNGVSQMPFYSRDENQSFDLINMSSEQHQHLDLNHYHPMPAPSEEKNCLLGHISPSIFLLKREDKFYVTDIKKVMAEFLTISLLEFVEKEELSGPLMISEPFSIPQGKIDRHFEELKNLGFDMDRLNPDVIALRTLPRFVPQILSREMTTGLIQYFSQNKISAFNTLDFKLFMEEHWPVTSPIPPHLLLEFIENPLLRSSGVFVELTNINLKSILK
jgi:DNA mismatch repair protein MutL